MTTAMTSTARDEYIEAVRAALSSQPEDVRCEVLDDVAEHLRELELEGDASLKDLLGEPDAYAAEFLASAGIDARVGTRHRLRQAVSGRVARAKQKFAGTRVDDVLRFIGSLRPAWWVVRGWFIVAAIAAVNEHGRSAPIPRVMKGDWQHTAASLAITIGAIVLSVLAAKRAKWLDLLATAVGIIAIIAFCNAKSPSVFENYGSGCCEDSTGGQTVADYSGTEVTNLYVYDVNGKPLKHAYVFRQDGKPLDLGNGRAVADYAANLDGGAPYAYVPGLFPQPEVTDTYDENGGYVERVTEPTTRPAVVIPKLPSDLQKDRPKK